VDRRESVLPVQFTLQSTISQEDFMDFQGSHNFSAPPQKVWDALNDPAVLKSSIPGAEEVQKNGDTFDVRIHISIPLLSGDFALPVQIASQNPPSQVVLTIDRAGSYGTIKAQATIDLAADGGGTNLTYTAHADLSGKIGMANNMIGEQAAKAGLNQFLKNLDSKV
jgi:carbon monoxide dehydrogenase subunit G